MAQKYLYHIRRKSMKGQILYPLNQLKEIHPEAYSEQIRKYEGREWIMNQRIPPLNCLWNDVIHLSPISPQAIIETFKNENFLDYIISHGFQTTGEFFKIPVQQILPLTTTYFKNENKSANQSIPGADQDWIYWPFEKDSYSEQSSVSSEQIDQWRAAKAIGKPLLWFSHTIHVLAKQTIDVSQFEILKCG